MKKHFIRNRKMRYGGIAVILTVLVVTVSILIDGIRICQLIVIVRNFCQSLVQITFILNIVVSI